MPFAAIEAEMRAQYPQLTDVVIALTEDDRQVVALVSVQKKKDLKSDDIERLQSWLQVRTGTTQATVIMH
jgi:hypothetical protein